MQIIVIALFVAGILGLILASFTYLQLELVVFERRPSLMPLQDTPLQAPWNRMNRFGEIAKAYKAEFPGGFKLRAFWGFTVSGIICFWSSFLLGLWFW